MSVETLLQPYAATVRAAARSADGGSYLTAYLTAAAVELIAVAALIGLLALGLGRGLPGATRLGAVWSLVWRGFDALALAKLIIPLAALAGLATVWASTVGA